MEWPTGMSREQAACQMLGKARPPQQASAAAGREVRAVSRRQESRGASFTFSRLDQFNTHRHLFLNTGREVFYILSLTLSMGA